MNQNPENVKEKINSILSHMEKYSFLFVKRPGHDFMRQYFGKLTFSDTMKLILSMEKSTVSSEIINYFDMDVDRIPTPSAFNQRRNQLSLFAFQYLLMNSLYLSLRLLINSKIVAYSLLMVPISSIRRIRRSWRIIINLV